MSRCLRRCPLPKKLKMLMSTTSTHARSALLKGYPPQRRLLCEKLHVALRLTVKISALMNYPPLQTTRPLSSLQTPITSACESKAAKNHLKKHTNLQFRNLLRHARRRAHRTPLLPKKLRSTTTTFAPIRTRVLTLRMMDHPVLTPPTYLDCGVRFGNVRVMKTCRTPNLRSR